MKYYQRPDDEIQPWYGMVWYGMVWRQLDNMVAEAVFGMKYYQRPNVTFLQCVFFHHQAK